MRLVLQVVCCHAAVLGATAQVVPEQVHLAFGKTPDAITVAWVSDADKSTEYSQVVEYGTAANALDSDTQGDTRPFTLDPNRVWQSHVATISGLKVNTQYFYRVGSNGSYTEVFNFINRRQGAPYRHVIFGDLGAACAFSVCSACTAASEFCNKTTCAGNLSLGLVAEVGKADMMLHTGDFGYDLDDDGGKTGDNFMNNIQQLAAYVPYMVSHGNHEDTDLKLAHYIERFRSQPANAEPATFTTKNGEAANTMYFSWDYGLVHYVSLSTELWFGVQDTLNTVNKSTQLAWLKKDLVTAQQNREAVPWIIVQGHRSVYCSCDGDCDDAAKQVRVDIEPILFQYGVDFYINGHEHNYERSYPLYQGNSTRSNTDPKAPIYIVSGSAGNTELHEPFTRPQPAWSAYRSNTFGYSVATVHNHTHLHWQQIQTDPTDFPGSDYGRVVDDAWIVQHKHGPFDPALAPQGEACPPEAGCGIRQHDHWWPLLGLDEGEGENVGRPTDAIIREARKTRGEKWWAQKLGDLMVWARKALGLGNSTWRPDKTPHGRPMIWEDVSDDGSSDKPPPADFKWCATRNGPQYEDQSPAAYEQTFV